MLDLGWTGRRGLPPPQWSRYRCGRSNLFLTKLKNSNWWVTFSNFATSEQQIGCNFVWKLFDFDFFQKLKFEKTDGAGVANGEVHVAIGFQLDTSKRLNMWKQLMGLGFADDFVYTTVIFNFGISIWDFWKLLEIPDLSHQRSAVTMTLGSTHQKPSRKLFFRFCFRMGKTNGRWKYLNCLFVQIGRGDGVAMWRRSGRYGILGLRMMVWKTQKPPNKLKTWSE